MTATKRDRAEQRAVELRASRAPWESTWWDIYEQVAPYRPLKYLSDQNQGKRKDTKILNNSPVLALGTLSAGMMAGITSPAREWHQETVADPSLQDLRSVKIWLDQIQAAISAALAQSNWYSSLANGIYPDLGAIGTAAMFEEEHAGRLVFTPLATGEYFLDINHFGQIDTCYREKLITVRQIVQKFGVDAVSPTVRRAWDKAQYAETRTVCNLIMPNEDFQPNTIGAQGKAWSSLWWEKGDNRKDAFLLEAGYETFPILAPRWSVSTGDVYGRGPGHIALGDCRELQYYEKEKHVLVDKMSKPPMKGHGVRRASLLPGDLTMGDASTMVYEPSLTINPASIPVVNESIFECRSRIEQAFYVDLWRTLIDDDRNERATATEIDAKRQERMVLLGPLLENLNSSLLEPAILRTYNLLSSIPGKLPPPPDELRGQEVKIKFISIMHQMQQATGLAGIRTLVDEATRAAQLDPGAADKVDVNVALDEVGRITGVRPDMIVPTEEVEKLQQARAEQEQAAQQGEAMGAAANTMKTLGETDGANIGELADQFGPVAQAQGGTLQ